jgi:hypothetical protein
VFRGIRTGRDRALGAALLAMTILCHLIPAIFAGIATVVLMFVRREDRVPWWDRSTVGRLVAAGLVLLTLLTIMPPVELPFGDAVISSPLPQWWFPAFGTAVAIVLLTGFEPRLVRWWLTPVGRAVGGAACSSPGGAAHHPVELDDADGPRGGARRRLLLRLGRPPGPLAAAGGPGRGRS